MSFDRANNAEGGLNGTGVSVANSGWGSGDAFNSITGVGMTYSSTVAQSGSLSIACPMSNSVQGPTISWTVPSLQKSIWLRNYIYATAFGANVSNGVLQSINAGSGLSPLAGINSAGKIYTYPGTGGAPNYVAGTGVYSLNTWYRLETQFNFATSQVTVMIYDNSGTLLETLASATNSVSWTGITTVSFGGAYITVSGSGILYMDNIAVSDSGWLGPAPAFVAPTTGFSRVNKATVGPASQACTSANTLASGYQMDSIVGTAPSYSSSYIYSGSYSYSCSCSTTLQSGWSWNTPGLTKNLWFRSWIFMNSVLANGYIHLQSFTSVVARSGINSSGKLIAYPGAGSSIIGTGAYVVNTWYRLETEFVYATNQVVVKIYDTSGTLLETLTSTASTTAWGVSSTASFGGMYSAPSGITELLMDYMAISDAGWIGTALTLPFIKKNNAAGFAGQTSPIGISTQTTGGASGDPFDSVGQASSATYQGVSNQILRPGSSPFAFYNNGQVQNCNIWNCSTLSTDIYVRGYFYIYGAMNSYSIARFFTAQNGAGTVIATAGMNNQLSNGGVYTMAPRVWYRMEARLHVGASGYLEQYLYDLAGNQLDHTISTPAATAACASISLGIGAEYTDSLAASDQGWIGAAADIPSVTQKRSAAFMDIMG